jgi:methyl-accepting chemotaxis protein
MADADTDAKPVDQDALVADIDRTRTELARTIDAIADRVSPKKNVARTMEQVRQRADQTMEQVRQRADRTMEQVRQGASQIDPLVAGVAAAAVAVGITALFLWRRSRR